MGAASSSSSGGGGWRPPPAPWRREGDDTPPWRRDETEYDDGDILGGVYVGDAPGGRQPQAVGAEEGREGGGGVGGERRARGNGAAWRPAKLQLPSGWPAVQAPHAPLRAHGLASEAAALAPGGGARGAGAEATQLRVREHIIHHNYDVSLMGAAGGAFAGMKESKRLVLRNAGPGVRRRLRVTDADSGAEVADVRRQFLSLAPIYRLRAKGARADTAVVRKRLVGLMPTYDIFVREADANGEAASKKKDPLRTRPVITATSSALELGYTFKDRRRPEADDGEQNLALLPLRWVGGALGVGESGARVAVADHNIGSILSGRDEYVLTVAPGVDPLVLACALAAIDDNEGYERKRW